MRVLPGLSVGIVAAVGLWALFADGNPGGISNATYSQFKDAAPPKLLYSCTRKPMRESLFPQVRACMDSGRAGCEQKLDEWVEAGTETAVEVVAGPRTSTYDVLLQKAKHKCNTKVGNLGPGEFHVLKAGKL